MYCLFPLRTKEQVITYPQLILILNLARMVWA